MTISVKFKICSFCFFAIESKMFEVMQQRRRRNRGGRNNRRGQRRCSRSSAPEAIDRSAPPSQQSGQKRQQGNSSSSMVLYREQRSSCSATSANSHGNKTIASAGANEQQQQPMNENVAKLLRGEHFSTTAVSPTAESIVRRKFAEPCDIQHYREQIQICVANPGRFIASWTLLAVLFGEGKLYEFVRQAAWTPEQLSSFVIPPEPEEGEEEDGHGQWPMVANGHHQHQRQ